MTKFGRSEKAFSHPGCGHLYGCVPRWRWRWAFNLLFLEKLLLQSW